MSQSLAEQSKLPVEEGWQDSSCERAALRPNHMLTGLSPAQNLSLLGCLNTEHFEEKYRGGCLQRASTVAVFSRNSAVFAKWIAPSLSSSLLEEP